MDSPILSFDALLNDVGSCDFANDIDDFFCAVSDYNSLVQDETEMEKSAQTSPAYSTDSGILPDAALGSERRSSDEMAGSPGSDWNDFDHEMDVDFADYMLSSVADAVNFPESCHSSSASDEDDTTSVSTSRGKRVTRGETRGVRRSARRTKQTVSYTEDSPSPSPVSCDNETEFVAVESSGIPSVSSGTGRPSVKIVKVIQRKDNHDSTTDVLKAIDEKNRKNALLARNNRAKKKQYVEDLEKQVKELSQSNACLEEKVEEMNRKIEELMADREHLKSVIMYATPLAGLLHNIQGVKFGADLGSCKRGSEAVDDHDYSSPHKKSRKSSSAGGGGVSTLLQSRQLWSSAPSVLGNLPRWTRNPTQCVCAGRHSS